ncbi:MAG: protein translocase subunit SecD, partial [Bacteroidales bacterium]|nr:protein translocase subunit SecD [Bacteroidales bacterium]
MQNKGAIKVFAIILALASIFQLSFTFFSNNVESKAVKYASNDQAVNMANRLAHGDLVKQIYYLDSISKARKQYYLDSMSGEVIYNILLKQYTYQDCKERELNLGLDLKGGMNVMLEVNVVDIVRALSGKSEDPTFKEAMNMAVAKQRESQRNFLDLFAESFEEIDPNARLAAIFAYEFKNKGITTNSTNAEVLHVIRTETEGAIDRSYQIIRTRIDRFGVAQPNIQRIGSGGRILVELPGIKDPERVRKLLQGTANLEFWETYSFTELAPYFSEANQRLKDILKAELQPISDVEEIIPDETTSDESLQETEEPALADEIEQDDVIGDQADQAEEASLEDLISTDSLVTQADQDELTKEQWTEENPLFSYLSPAYYQKDGQLFASEGAAVGYASIKDTASVNRLLKLVKNILPRNLKLVWTAKHERWQEDNILTLYALKITTRDGEAPLSGDVIVNASQDYDQNGQVEVSMTMNAEGARVWKRLTGENIGHQIAIVLDDYVRSAPNVNSEIPTGQSSISGGGMTVEEAQDMANILKAGKLPARARIVQEAVVGPSLGHEAINAGLSSFILALVLVLLYMVFYYNRAGLVADIALMSNIFFLFGILASLGAVLTLPGIAGIVLTLGMAVDANVIIYERIKEEIRLGKGVRLAISDGYKNAYS